ncbi:MAG: AraC family transcriptional regulator [Pseudomonadota bacterium]
MLKVRDTDYRWSFQSGSRDRFEEYEVEDGLTLRLVDIKFDKVSTLDGLIGQFRLACILDGNFTGQVTGLPKIVADKSQLQLNYWSGTKSAHFTYPAGSHLRSVQILMSPEYILKHIGHDTGIVPQLLLTALQSPKGGYFADFRRLSPALRVIAEQVLRSELPATLNHAFFRAKALEMLAVGFSELMSDEPTKQAILLSVLDVERVRKAREILRERRVSPPTLSELAHMVGLNEFKLKQGFRFVYNTSAFALLSMDRMQEAEQLLKKGGMNVAQVGYQVGYTSNAAFSRAFQRHFGYPPSAALRNSAIDPLREAPPDHERF